MINARAKIRLNLNVLDLDKRSPVAFLLAPLKGLQAGDGTFHLKEKERNPACGLNTFTRGAQKAAK
jgi:hypothetical protein